MGSRIVLPPPKYVHLSIPENVTVLGLVTKRETKVVNKTFKSLQNREITLAYQSEPMTSLGSLKVEKGNKVESEK